jgi:geranylgeranyl pyrophosphate synthase
MSKTFKKASQDDNLIDVTVTVKAKASPKLQKLISTTTEAGKTIINVGKRLLPLLILLSTIATSCAPKNQEPKSREIEAVTLQNCLSLDKRDQDIAYVHEACPRSQSNS